MTTFRPGRMSACVLAQYLLSPLLNQADHTWQLSTGETTHFGSTAKEFIAGVQSGTLALSGMYDGTPVPGASTNVSADNIINSLVGQAADIATIMFMDGGMAVGRKCYMVSGKITNYTPSAPIGGVETMKVDVQHNGPILDGLCLVDGVTTAPAGATTNFAVVDNAVSSANGGTAYFHLPTNSSTGAVTLKVQHSADNITFTDLAVANVIAASTTGYQTLAVAGTVNRYVRAAVVVAAGTGSALPIVAFNRN